MRKAAAYIVSVIFMILSSGLYGQKAGLEFENQISTWLGMNFPDEVKWQAGIRYVPTLSPWVRTGANGKIDAEFSVNTFGTVHLSPLLILEDGKDEPKPVKTVPEHFAPVSTASRAATSPPPWPPRPSATTQQPSRKPQASSLLARAPVRLRLAVSKRPSDSLAATRRPPLPSTSRESSSSADSSKPRSSSMRSFLNAIAVVPSACRAACA